MIVSTFGEGLAGQIDLKNLSTFIENQVAFEAANVKQVYDTFARRFGTQANARTQRFASSTRTFNYFVTGFTYEKELSLYSAQAQSFYEWVIFLLILKLIFYRVPNLMSGSKKSTPFNFPLK